MRVWKWNRNKKKTHIWPSWWSDQVGQNCDVSTVSTMSTVIWVLLVLWCEYYEYYDVRTVNAVSTVMLFCEHWDVVRWVWALWCSDHCDVVMMEHFDVVDVVLWALDVVRNCVELCCDTLPELCCCDHCVVCCFEVQTDHSLSSRQSRTDTRKL